MSKCSFITLVKNNAMGTDAKLTSVFIYVLLSETGSIVSVTRFVCVFTH